MKLVYSRRALADLDRIAIYDTAHEGDTIDILYVRHTSQRPI